MSACVRDDVMVKCGPGDNVVGTTTEPVLNTLPAAFICLDRF